MALICKYRASVGTLIAWKLVVPDRLTHSPLCSHYLALPFQRMELYNSPTPPPPYLFFLVRVPSGCQYSMRPDRQHRAYPSLHPSDNDSCNFELCSHERLSNYSRVGWAAMSNKMPKKWAFAHSLHCRLRTFGFVHTSTFHIGSFYFFSFLHF